MAEKTAAAPATETPAVAVTGVAPAAPAADAAPVVAAAPAETPVVETPVEKPATEVVSEPTLLEQTTSPGKETPAAAADAKAEPKTEAKTEEAKPADDGKKAAAEAKPDAKAEEAKTTETKDAAAEAAVAKPAAPEAIEYKYELPETLKMDDETRTATHAAFDAFRADPANPQPLIDLHRDAMQRHDARVRQEQWDVFNNTRKEWRDAVMADEEIGGAGHRTAMQAIARMRDRFASSEKPGTKAYDADLQAFDGMLRATGVGDHPIFLKMLHRVAQIYDEPAMGVVNVTPAPQKKGPGVLYDNPRSGVKQ